VAGGVEFLGWLEYSLCADGGSGVVSGEQGLEFADDLLCGGFRDQVGRVLSIDPRNITQ
jgi:hypothetical protein